MIFEKIWQVFVRPKEEFVHKDTRQQRDIDESEKRYAAQMAAEMEATKLEHQKFIDELQARKKCADFYKKHGRHPSDKEFLDIIAGRPSLYEDKL